MLNGDHVTQSHEHYNYRAYFETLLSYDTDAASSYFSNSYWYLDNGDINSCEPMNETHTSATNNGFIARWRRLSGSREVQLQFKLTKARPSFYLMNKTSYKKIIFKFLDVYQMVRRMQPNPLFLSAHETALAEGALAWYNMTSVDRV